MQQASETIYGGEAMYELDGIISLFPESLAKQQLLKWKNENIQHLAIGFTASKHDPEEHRHFAKQSFIRLAADLFERHIEEKSTYHDDRPYGVAQHSRRCFIIGKIKR